MSVWSVAPAVRLLACSVVAMLNVLMAASSVQAQEVVEYYGTDHLGSIRVVFDAAGNLISRADYLPFGEELAAAGAMPAEHFTGQARDAEAGQDYFHARMYKPQIGRFITFDPAPPSLAVPQSFNRYGYVRNNPAAYTDPMGLCDVDVCVVGKYEHVGLNTPGFMTPGLFGWGDGGGWVLGQTRLGSGNGFGGRRGPRPGTGGTDPGGTDPDESDTNTDDTEAEEGGDDDILVDAANFCSGFGDMLTSGFGITDLFGLPSGTEAVRNMLGFDVVDMDSRAYSVGAAAGEVWGALAGAAGGGAAAGYQVTTWSSKSGAGINVVRNHVRRFGADWNRFKLNGEWVNLPHLHYGSTKSQMKKHRPYQGGWRCKTKK